MEGSSDLPDIIVISICHDQDTGRLYLEYDDDALNDYEVLAYLYRAHKMHDEAMDGVEEEDDEE